MLVPSMVRPQVTGNQLNPMETLDAKAWRRGEVGVVETLPEWQ